MISSTKVFEAKGFRLKPLVTKGYNETSIIFFSGTDENNLIITGSTVKGISVIFSDTSEVNTIGKDLNDIESIKVENSKSVLIKLKRKRGSAVYFTNVLFDYGIAYDLVSTLMNALDIKSDTQGISNGVIHNTLLRMLAVYFKQKPKDILDERKVS